MDTLTMYGVPTDLPLNRFIGKEIGTIILGRFQVEFLIDDGGSITARSLWELRDQAGALIDRAVENSMRDCYRVHPIIGIPIVGFTIDPPRSFILQFDSGHALQIFDDSEQYESFEIEIIGEGHFII